MPSTLHLLEIGIAIVVFGGIVYWAFASWSRSHQQHQDDLRSSRDKNQAWDTRGRNR